jgi:hypothetical protein
MNSIKAATYVKAASIAASVPMIVMIIGAGRKF